MQNRKIKTQCIKHSRSQKLTKSGCQQGTAALIPKQMNQSDHSTQTKPDIAESYGQMIHPIANEFDADTFHTTFTKYF
jgi:hypothetical protein